MTKLSKLTENLAEKRSRHIIRMGFVLIIMIIVFFVIFGLNQLAIVNQSLTEIVNNEQAAIEKLFRMQQTSRDRSVVIYHFISTTDPFERDEQMQIYTSLGAQFAEARDQLNKLNLNEHEKAVLAQLRDEILATQLLHLKVFELVANNQIQAAQEIMNKQAIPAQDKILEGIGSLLDEEIQESHEKTQRLQQQKQQTQIMMITAGSAAIIFVWFIASYITRRIRSLISSITSTAKELDETNKQLEFIQQAVNKHNIVSIADVHGDITYVNDLLCQISQYSKQELIGQNHRLLKSGVQPDEIFYDLWRTISSGKVWQGSICNRDKQGGHYWVATTIVPMLDDAGLPSQYISVRTDITAIKEAQQVLLRSKEELESLVQERSLQLQEHEEVLYSITSAAQDAVIMVDHLGEVTFWNPAAEKMFGYTTTEARHQNLLQLIAPSSQHTAFNKLFQTGEKPLIGTTSEVLARRKDQSEFPVEISISSVNFKTHWHAVAIIRDITARKMSEERLKLLATTDTLTGTYNRRYFNEMLQNELSRAQRYETPLSLIIMDIDHFKQVNDTYGHQIGDHVLIQFSALIASALRESDVLARWGGEEFTILAPNCDEACGLRLAEKLRISVENETFPDAGKITCSFGVTSFRDDDDQKTLVKRVDDSLYRAKNAGRNRVESS